MIVITKYHPNGSRISAHAPGWDLPRVYISYPHQKSGADCHGEAVRALMKKAGVTIEKWRIERIPGGYVFVTAAGWELTLQGE